MKKTSKLLDGTNSYLSIPDTSDWKFGKGKGKDFIMCFYWDKNIKGKYIFHSCSCKKWTKCKGFKK